MTEGTSASRRLTFAAILAVLLVAAVEGLSRVAYRVVGAGPLAEVAAERDRLAGTAPEGNAARSELAAPDAAAREALHPFLGFVFDPAINERERRRERGMLEVTELGFFRPPGPPRPPPEGAFRIAVVGGSAAFLFSFTGRDRLIADLDRSPALAGRPVTVDSFAIGGYKQPQQLLTVAWLLSLGERFDLVVNLDGFNEVALPVEERAAEVFPPYPRGWRQRIAGLEGAEAQREAGRATLLREERADLARSFSRRPWRSSAAAILLWRARDRRLAVRLAEAEARLAAAPMAGTGYAAQGPPVSYPDEGSMLRDLAETWRHGSLQLSRLCAANGVRYLHFLQPNQYDPGSKPLSREEWAQAFLADHPYRHAVEAGYPHLRAAGAALRRDGVAFIDLSQIFAAVEETLYFDTCCHVNGRGNEILAEAIARAIVADLASRPAAESGKPPGR